MSAIDRSRVVNISDEQLDEFSCGICHSILYDPVLTKCCGQLFCKLCLHEWLKQSAVCPNDRQTLKISELSRPPRIVTNLLGNMKIKCEFHEQGCKMIDKIEQIEKHVGLCDKNPNRLCETCGVGSETDLNHNCFANLQINKCYVDEEIQKLRKELSMLKNKLDQYNEGNIPESHMLSVIETARQNFDRVMAKPGTNNQNITAFEKNKFIGIAKLAINNLNNYTDIAFFINHYFQETEATNAWHSVVFAANGGQSCIPDRDYLELRFGPLFIEFFKDRSDHLNLNYLG